MKKQDIINNTLPDRSRPPQTRPLAEMVWPVVEQAAVPIFLNKLPVDLIEAGGHDVVRIEWQFPVGSFHEPRPLVASLTNRMLQEGSVGHNSRQIAEKLDYYGAYLHREGGVHRSVVGVYTLGKHLESVLPLMWELIFEPTFPEEELHTTRQNRIQELAVSRNKVSVLSRERMMALLFGPNHPYGYSTREEDLLRVTCKDLRKFHKTFYHIDDLRIVVAGGNTREALRKLQDSYPTHGFPPSISISSMNFPGKAWKNHEPPLPLPEVKSWPYWHHVEKPEASQHALRMGRLAPPRSHPDYPALEILVTILGGYFGSRLMKNLREDKGFTYGVGAALHSRVMSGWISISTEVGASVVEEAKAEIIHELNRLCEEPVSEEELSTVRAYLEGTLRSAFEGPFSPADRLADVQVFGLDLTYYRRYLEILRNIGPAQLQDLAATYIRPSTFTAVAAGGSATSE